MYSDIIIHKALRQQQNEIDDFTIYSLLSNKEKNEESKKLLLKIASEEKRHYHFLHSITSREKVPRKIVVSFYVFIATFLGISFSLKLLENREESAKQFYADLIKDCPEAKEIYEQEMYHEVELINMLHDKKLLYAGAIVLGMNDALVELTGTLSGIALAFDKSNIVGATGLIMGIAASLSMAGSAYLESKENPTGMIRPAMYSLYTGVSYILTTLLLILPFFIFDSILTALLLMFFGAFIAILAYNFYISVAKELPFWQRVREMSYITFGVALISFGIGYCVKHYFGIDI